MKRIVCLILAVILLLSSFSVVYAKGDDDKDNIKSLEKIVEQLKKYYENKYKGYEVVEKVIKMLDEYLKNYNDSSKNDDKHYYVNGKKVKVKNSSVIKYNRLLIPVNAVEKNLGADVEWDSKARIATIKKGDRVITINFVTHMAKINNIEMDLRKTSVYKKNGTIVLLKFISEALEMDLDQEENNYEAVTYEAEKAELSGGASVSKLYSGYTGTGYVSGYWNKGASCAFTVNVPDSGYYDVSLRFANATGEDRTLSILVNGKKVKQTVLKNLSDWNKWDVKNERLELKAGKNVITYVYDRNDTGNVNIDNITVSAPGILTGSVSTVSGNVNLSRQGALDWVHWGYKDVSGFNRKKGVTRQISNFTKVGNGSVTWISQNSVSYSWSDGTPTESAAGVVPAIFTSGKGNGFEITVPAGTDQKTLSLYVGAWKAKGKLEARLSDNSAPVYSCYIDSPSDIVTNVVTLSFRAAKDGQKLIIRYTLDSEYQANTGHITLQAAALK